MICNIGIGDHFILDLSGMVIEKAVLYRIVPEIIQKLSEKLPYRISVDDFFSSLWTTAK